jgi:hypothetical protein
MVERTLHARANPNDRSNQAELGRRSTMWSYDGTDRGLNAFACESTANREGAILSNPVHPVRASALSVIVTVRNLSAVRTHGSPDSVDQCLVHRLWCVCRGRRSRHR